MTALEYEYAELESDTFKLLENKSKQIKASFGIKMHKQNLNDYVNCYKFATG